MIAVTPDEYFNESSWILVDGESNEVAAGDFESADVFTATLELPDGDYCFTMADSYGDGGTTGTITLNGVEYYTWAADDYTTGAEFCFTIDSTCFASAEGLFWTLAVPATLT